MMKNFTLSYPVSSVNWDGKCITALPQSDYQKHFELLCSIGIKEVMLTGYADHEPSNFDICAETVKVGKLLQSLGMKAAQHHGLCPIYAPLGEPQQKAVDMLKQSIRYSANLHADVLVIHPGWCTDWRSPSNIERFEAAKRENKLDELLEICGRNLHEAGKFAGDNGVLIALENVDRFEPMATIQLLPRLVEAADSPAVGYCLDAGHANCCYGNVLDWIDTMGNKLFTTHFHDNRGRRLQALSDDPWISPRRIDEHLPPGFGVIPWVEVIHGLHRIEFERTVNFESGQWPDMPEKEGLQAAIRYWRCCEFLAAKDNVQA